MHGIIALGFNSADPSEMTFVLRSDSINVVNYYSPSSAFPLSEVSSFLLSSSSSSTILVIISEILGSDNYGRKGY